MRLVAVAALTILSCPVLASHGLAPAWDLVVHADPLPPGTSSGEPPRLGPHVGEHHEAITQFPIPAGLWLDTYASQEEPGAESTIVVEPYVSATNPWTRARIWLTITEGRWGEGWERDAELSVGDAHGFLTATVRESPSHSQGDACAPPIAATTYELEAGVGGQPFALTLYRERAIGRSCSGSESGATYNERTVHGDEFVAIQATGLEQTAWGAAWVHDQDHYQRGGSSTPDGEPLTWEQEGWSEVAWFGAGVNDVSGTWSANVVQYEDESVGPLGTARQRGTTASLVAQDQWLAFYHTRGNVTREGAQEGRWHNETREEVGGWMWGAPLAQSVDAMHTEWDDHTKDAPDSWSRSRDSYTSIGSRGTSGSAVLTVHRSVSEGQNNFTFDEGTSRSSWEASYSQAGLSTDAVDAETDPSGLLGGPRFTGVTLQEEEDHQRFDFDVIRYHNNVTSWSGRATVLGNDIARATTMDGTFQTTSDAGWTGDRIRRVEVVAGGHETQVQFLERTWKDGDGQAYHWGNETRISQDGAEIVRAQSTRTDDDTTTEEREVEAVDGTVLVHQGSGGSRVEMFGALLIEA